MAGIMCQDFVKNRLRSPGSAKFPGVMDGEPKVSSLGSGRYSVRSYVDSENGFGALLRSDWSCEIRKVPGGDKWQLESQIVLVPR